jgi:hypothetical protein
MNKHLDAYKAALKNLGLSMQHCVLAEGHVLKILDGSNIFDAAMLLDISDIRKRLENFVYKLGDYLSSLEKRWQYLPKVIEEEKKIVARVKAKRRARTKFKPKYELGIMGLIQAIHGYVPDDLLPEEQLQNATLRALNLLYTREERVIRRRFAIDCAFGTLQEIGEDLGILKERVRQIQNKALRKLRHPKRFSLFRVSPSPPEQIPHTPIQEEQPPARNPWLIEDLFLSLRACNGLRNAGIETIGQLMQKNPQDILRIKKLGRKSLCEIQEVLSEMGLFLEDQRFEAGSITLPKP